MNGAENAKGLQLTMHVGARSEPGGAPAEVREREMPGAPRPEALASGEPRDYREAAPFHFQQW
jgi:hypothetical protein